MSSQEAAWCTEHSDGCCGLPALCGGAGGSEGLALVISAREDLRGEVSRDRRKKGKQLAEWCLGPVESSSSIFRDVNGERFHPHHFYIRNEGLKEKISFFIFPAGILMR